MILETSVSPPNSVLLIMDQSIGQVPESMSGNLVSATESCIAVGTALAHEQETKIILSNECVEISDDLMVTFEGEIETPERKISVCNVYNETIATVDTRDRTSLVRVLVNDNAQPTEIRVFVREIR